ncbi:hypothetical protein CS542_08135 [Pedobacter sp. IW39]|nr:hypothetical protein CS542_08135 [Pedobacter sp. IW39]
MITDMGIKPDFVSGNSLGNLRAWLMESDATAAIEATEQAKSICRRISWGMLAVLTEEEN